MVLLAKEVQCLKQQRETADQNARQQIIIANQEKATVDLIAQLLATQTETLVSSTSIWNEIRQLKEQTLKEIASSFASAAARATRPATNQLNPPSNPHNPSQDTGQIPLHHRHIQGRAMLQLPEVLPIFP